MYSETYIDQVEKRKQRLEKVNYKDDKGGEEEVSLSRMELHHSKKRKKKKKRNFPLLKVLLTFFILLPISTILAYTYFSQHQSPLKVGSLTSPGGEEVSYETDNSDLPQKQQTVENTDKNSNETAINDEQSSDSNSNIASNGTTTVQNTENKVEQVNQEQNASDNSEQVTNAQTNETANIQIIDHVVQPKETLFSISMKYFHSKDGIEKIIQQNHIINNEIQVGQTLQIPLPK
ncbi:MAG: LysM peptidoglycan-binding domain-containing protein [Heyndrickxia sp.]